MRSVLAACSDYARVHTRRHAGTRRGLLRKLILGELSRACVSWPVGADTVSGGAALDGAESSQASVHSSFLPLFTPLPSPVATTAHDILKE